MPGFHRARRYVAVKASPKYLATYECDKRRGSRHAALLACAGQPDAVERAGDGRFTHFHRMTMRVQLDLAHGEGGALTAVRFVPQPARCAGSCPTG